MEPFIFQAIQNQDLSNLDERQLETAAAALLVEYHRLQRWCATCLGTDVSDWDGQSVE